VTKHLKVLQRAGLITQSRQAQWRPCKLEVQPLREAADWVAQYRQHWEERLDQCFSDPQGSVTRNPWASTWPLYTHSTTTLT
jgi:hypothetical protein